jgi:hypothetical protein
VSEGWVDGCVSEGWVVYEAYEVKKKDFFYIYDVITS